MLLNGCRRRRRQNDCDPV